MKKKMELRELLGWILIAGSIVPYVCEISSKTMLPLENLGILIWCLVLGIMLIKK